MVFLGKPDLHVAGDLNMAPAGFTGATRPSNLWVQNGLPTLLLISVVALAFHAALALWVPVFQDESYYALWATRPAIDYYDHPPMIALWIWAGRAIFGTTFLGVRVVSVLTLALVPAMVYRIAWLVSHDRRTAQVAALFYATMTTPIVLGFSSTPDSPSVVFWAFSTMALFEAIKDPVRKSTGWFAIFGVALGLGVLSKFTNLFLILGIGMWLIFTRPGRRIFARSGAWVAIGATVVTVLPFLIWNAQHDWYGFQRQFPALMWGRWRIRATQAIWLSSSSRFLRRWCGFLGAALCAQAAQRDLVWFTYCGDYFASIIGRPVKLMARRSSALMCLCAGPRFSWYH